MMITKSSLKSSLMTSSLAQLPFTSAKTMWWNSNSLISRKLQITSALSQAFTVCILIRQVRASPVVIGLIVKKRKTGWRMAKDIMQMMISYRSILTRAAAHGTKTVTSRTQRASRFILTKIATLDWRRAYLFGENHSLANNRVRYN